MVKTQRKPPDRLNHNSVKYVAPCTTETTGAHSDFQAKGPLVSMTLTKSLFTMILKGNTFVQCSFYKFSKE